jgi:hypothetical protein
MNVERGGPKGDLEACARLYRVVHRWPQLAGVPIPLFLALMMGTLMSVFAVSLVTGSGLGSAVPVALIGLLVWAGLAWLFQKDQVALPLALLRYRAPLRSVISSYRVSVGAVVIDDEGRDQ